MTHRLVLGTVQLGMDYGVSNLGGQPSRQAAFELLTAAWEAGIRYFDTAPVYGSESLLGNFIIANGVNSEIKMLTKIPEIKNMNSWEEQFNNSLSRSLDNLKCTTIDTLFFHHASDANLLKAHPETFHRMMKQWPVSSFGISVYEPGDCLAFQTANLPVAIQFPYNTVNRVFDALDWSLGPRFARSVFLQGLLASAGALRENVPQAVVEFHRSYHSLLAQANIEPKSFALSFALNAVNTDKVLIGVNSVKELEELLACPLMTSSEQEEVSFQGLVINPKELDPRVWPS
ncbi:MAG: hypothetical protein CMH56_07460 [Myxococcales bacterium]|nr:hypothetical protein [Myxococcales bacterium]|tara:strand:+ start:662 stop:1525 length:864 start_codon:yes stop_codon:yes gene_type:complete